MIIILIIRHFLEKYLLNKMKTLTKYYEDLVLNPEPNCFCMLKPGFAKYKDEFEKLLNLQGWKIIAQCIKKFTRDEIEDFYIMHKDKPFYHKLCDYMITDECVCYTCYKNCQDPFKDMDAFKKKIRDEWGEDEMKNGMHSSDCKENMKKECLIAFNTVNEKLKVSKSNEITLTEFADAFKSNNCKELDLCDAFNISDVNDCPDYLTSENKKIIKIRFRHENRYDILTILVLDLKIKNYIGFDKYITPSDDNEPVSFISQEDAEKIMDYLYGNI